MKYSKLNLSELNSFIHSDATVEFYLLENTPEENNELKPAMIVVPGGGYSFGLDCNKITNLQFFLNLSVFYLQFSLE